MTEGPKEFGALMRAARAGLQDRLDRANDEIDAVSTEHRYGNMMRVRHTSWAVTFEQPCVRRTYTVPRGTAVTSWVAVAVRFDGELTHVAIWVDAARRVNGEGKLGTKPMTAEGFADLERSGHVTTMRTDVFMAIT